MPIFIRLSKVDSTFNLLSSLKIPNVQGKVIKFKHNFQSSGFLFISINTNKLNIQATYRVAVLSSLLFILKAV